MIRLAGRDRGNSFVVTLFTLQRAIDIKTVKRNRTARLPEKCFFVIRQAMISSTALSTNEVAIASPRWRRAA